MSFPREFPPDRGYEALDEAVAKQTGYKIDFGRDDTDSYNLNVSSLKDNSSTHDQPGNGDLLPLLPRGSAWEAARGWRSFFGVPYRFGENLWIAVGLRVVVGHDRRGAYPTSRFYLVPFEPESVATILDRLLNRLVDQPEAGGTVGPSYGAVRSGAREPGDHRSTELDVLRRARAAYREGIRLLFRTAVLTEDELPSSSFLGLFGSASSPEDSRLVFGRSLYATIPPVHADFDWSSRLQVFLETDLTF